MRQSTRHILNILVTVALAALVGCNTFKRMQDAGVVTFSDESPRVNFLAVKQLFRTDCGVACLCAVMNHWGSTISQDNIKTSLGAPPKGGYTLPRLQNFAESQGFVAFLFSGSFETLHEQCSLGRPCIIVFRKSSAGNHSYVVLDTKVSDGEWSLRVMDPAKGKIRSVSSRSLERAWQAVGSPILLMGRKEVQDEVE